jgi:small subunit ribosomal protein S18
MSYSYVAARPTGCKHCKKTKTEDGSPGLYLIDYKNVRLLQKMCTPQGKMYGRKRSGLCAHCQRVLKRAVRRARFLGTLAHVGQ